MRLRWGDSRGKFGRMSGVSRAARPTLLLLCGALVFAAFLALTAPVGADGGVPIPAPAGTTWRIIAGYNTSTHSVADDLDPHAIDIVRLPQDQTAFTPVLAPVSGTIAWRGWDGLTITDSAGYEHLLAHVYPVDHIQRGTFVEVGEQVATICPAHDCRNYGTPHIHYAIHQSQGAGRLGHSVPFTGDYAIEGLNLHWSDEYNLHGGVELTSTNTRNWIAPPVSPTDRPETNSDSNTGTPDADQEPVRVPESDPEPTWIVPADAPVGGWRTVGVYERTSVAGLFANLRSPLLEFVVHNPFLDAYHRFDPNDEASAAIAVQSLRPGQAVWALVEPEARWLPAPPVSPRSVTIRLAAGTNMVSWQGPDRDIAEALRNVAHLERAYRYDPRTDSWDLYVPGGPSVLNTLGELRSGDAFHLVVEVGSTWTQLP